MIRKRKTIGSLFTRAKSALFSRTTPNDSPHLTLSQPRLMAGLAACAAALVVATPQSAQAQADVFVESRSGGKNFANYSEDTVGFPNGWANTSVKSSATGTTAGIGARFNSNAGVGGAITWFQVTPTLPVAGGSYKVYVTIPSGGSAGTAVTSTITVTGGSGLPSTTTAFSAGGENTWKLVGTLNLNPGVSTPTVRFDETANNNRFIADAVKFEYVPPAAAVRTWDGGGANDNFSTALNWGGTAPVAGDGVVFDGSTRLSPSLDASLSISGIRFATGADAFSITRPGSQVLTVTGDITNSSPNLQTIGAQVTVSGSGRFIDTGAAGIANTAGTVAASGFTKIGSGTLTLQGGSNPNLAGTVTINGGSILVNANNQIADTAVVALASGTSLQFASGVSETIRRVASGSLAANAVAGNIDLAANVQLTMNPNASFAGASSASAVQINGDSGTVFTLTGGELRWTPENMVNTFEKLVIGPGAILRAGHGGNAWLPPETMLGAVPASFMQDQITINNGQLGINSSLSGQTVSVHPNRGMTITGLATNETFQNVYFPGKITGTGTLVHTGGGDLELAGLNDFSGGLRLGSGPVTLANDSAAGTGAITFLTGGSLKVSAEGLTIANPIDLSAPLVSTFGGTTNYTLSGDVNLGSSGDNTAITIPSATVTMSGSLTNTLGFNKAGAGTLVLAGNSTFTGAINVNAGTLHYASTGVTSAGTLTVNNGGTLSGTGTIQGGVTVASGGTISAGASPGTLNTGNQVWNGGGINVVEVNDATGTAGSGWDLLNVDGTLTINATIGDKFILDVVSLAGSTPGSAANFDGESDYAWTIVTTTGGITGFDPAAFDIPTSNFSDIPSGGGFTLSVVGNDLVLNYSQSNPPLITAQPAASQTVATGTEVILSATVTGTEPITYGWKKDNVLLSNGGNISGADTATLTIANSVPGDSGTYVLVVENSVGDDTSDPAVVTVIDAPVITAQPSGATVNEGGNFNPSATVTGGGTLVYQWKKNGDDVSNGGNISGADTASLSITSVTVDQAGDYTLVVSNEVGSDASSAATLVILSAPVITQQPQDVGVGDGATAEFTVTATGHDLEYQWSRNGEEIAGATDSSYSVAASASTIGFYTVVVSNNLGTETSTSASLSINSETFLFDDFETGTLTANGWVAANTILTLSEDQAVSPTQSAKISSSAMRMSRNFNVEVTGELRATFWMYDNGNTAHRAIMDIRGHSGTPGIINGTLTHLFGAGKYNNAAGDPAWISTNYQARIIAPGINNFFNLNAPTAPRRTVGWHKFEIVREADMVTVSIYVDGALGRTFTLGAASPGLDSVYIGSAAAGSSTDTAYFDDINIAQAVEALAITEQPENILANAGSTAEFSVTAPGATVYQWKKDGINIPDATDSTLTLNNVLKADEGSYSVYIENGFSAIISDAASLTVNDPAIDTQPESASVANGGNASFSVVAVGTGTLTYQWKQNGNDINDATDATYSITGASMTDAGNYTVVVTGDHGFVTSDVAVLTVLDGVTITGQPASTSVNQGAPASFEVVANGGTPLSYQWRFNGVDISGATDSTYVIASAHPDDAGDYTVLVSNPVDSQLSTAGVLTVVPDTIAPVVKVVSPKNNSIHTTAPVTIEGTATDAVGVETVTYSLNDGAPVTVAYTAPNWTGSITPAPGTNTIVVTATDLAGNSASSAPIRFFYHVASPLTIQTNLNGVVITTNGVGTVVNAIPLALQSGNNTNLFVGRTYTLKAIESGAPAYILTNWTATWNGQATPVVLQTNSLVCTFEMKEDMILSANFIDNPFYRFGGVYNGLFSEAGGVAFNSAGYVTMKVNPKRGLSGKVFVDGNAVSFSGKLDLDGTGTIVTKARNKATDKPELTINVVLDFAGQSDSVSGTITEAGDAWSSSLLAHRVVWTLDDIPTAYTNRYGMHIPGFADNNEGPVGTGYGAILIDYKGKIKLAGFLADGHVLKQGTMVSANGDWPFFSPLYKEKRPNALAKIITETQGIAMGWLQFTNAPAANKAPSGEVHWIKTGWTNATYAGGFTNHNVDILGSRWAFDPLDPAASAAGLGSQVTISFTDGDLGSSFSNDWLVTVKGGLAAIKIPSPNPPYVYENFVKAGLAAKTGLYKGTFVHPSNQAVTKHFGLVLQDYDMGEGFFMGPSLGGKTTLAPAVLPE